MTTTYDAASDVKPTTLSLQWKNDKYVDEKAPVTQDCYKIDYDRKLVRM